MDGDQKAEATTVGEETRLREWRLSERELDEVDESMVSGGKSQARLVRGACTAAAVAAASEEEEEEEEEEAEQNEVGGIWQVQL
jgi:hypothetical protein